MSASQTDILASIQEAYEYVQSDGKLQVTLDHKLSELGVSSIGALEMAAFLEERYDVDFPDDQLAKLDRVNTLVELIQQAISDK